MQETTVSKAKQIRALNKCKAKKVFYLRTVKDEDVVKERTFNGKDLPGTGELFSNNANTFISPQNIEKWEQWCEKVGEDDAIQDAEIIEPRKADYKDESGETDLSAMIKDELQEIGKSLGEEFPERMTKVMMIERINELRSAGK